MDIQEYKKKVEELKILRKKLNYEYEKSLELSHNDEMKSYVGKYFKYLNSCDSESKWYEYIEVIDVLTHTIHSYDNGDILFKCKVNKFCQMPDGEICIHKNTELDNSILEIEITEGQFVMAQQEILNNL